MTEGLDPRLVEVLRAWREESAAPSDSTGRSAARMAMREAVHEQAPAPTWSTGAWRDRLARAIAAMRAHPRLVAAALAPLAVVGLTALGWSSPADSPLHFVEVSRERAELALPGADRAGLELSFAESRLQDAALGKAPAASVREADSLLHDARRDLPSNPGRLARRLRADAERLNIERATLPMPASGNGATPAPCPTGLCGVLPGSSPTPTPPATAPTTAPTTGIPATPTPPTPPPTPMPAPAIPPTPVPTIPPTPAPPIPSIPALTIPPTPAPLFATPPPP